MRLVDKSRKLRKMGTECSWDPSFAGDALVCYQPSAYTPLRLPHIVQYDQRPLDTESQLCLAIFYIMGPKNYLKKRQLSYLLLLGV